MIEGPQFFSSTLVGEGVMVEGDMVEGDGQGRWQARKVETQVTRILEQGMTKKDSRRYCLDVT
jgi:hypothetical protein